MRTEGEGGDNSQRVNPKPILLISHQYVWNIKSERHAKYVWTCCVFICWVLIFNTLRRDNPSHWNVTSQSDDAQKETWTLLLSPPHFSGERPHISRQPSYYCFSCPLTNNRKMETQSAPRDLRSVSSVLWWRHLNCLLIYNYTVFCVFRFHCQPSCVSVFIFAV